MQPLRLRPRHGRPAATVLRNHGARRRWRHQPDTAGRKTVARRSPRSEDASPEPVPTSFLRPLDLIHANSTPLTFRSLGRSAGARGGEKHPEVAGCPSLTPPPDLNVGTTSPKRHSAATLPHRKEGRRAGGRSHKRDCGRKASSFPLAAAIR